jgi:hypothetical protein
MFVAIYRSDIVMERCIAGLCTNGSKRLGIIQIMDLVH